MQSSRMSFFEFCFVAISLLCAVSYASIKGLHPLGKSYSIVLVGGGLKDDNEDIWNTIIELGGGTGKARFGVISAASEDPCCDEDSSWVYYNDLLTKYGAAEVYYIPVTIDSKGNNSDPAVVEHVRTLTGFFFGGGDQLRIIYSFFNAPGLDAVPVTDASADASASADAASVLKEGGELDSTEMQAAVFSEPSEVLLAIKQTLLATGGVVAGTSAGTDCQTNKVMITGGESNQALLEGSQVFWRPIEVPNLTRLTGYGPGGIGFFQHGLLDTHFANRGRHGRLLKLLADTAAFTAGSTRAFGIDENTALVVQGPWQQRRAAVLGERGVWIFDASTAVTTEACCNSGSSSSSGGGGTQSMQSGAVLAGVHLSRLSAGDLLDLNSYRLTPATYKKHIVETNTEEPDTSDDIFAEDAFEMDRIIQSLLENVGDSTFGLSVSAGESRSAAAPPRFKVVLGKQWSTEELHASLLSADDDTALSPTAQAQSNSTSAQPARRDQIIDVVEAKAALQDTKSEYAAGGFTGGFGGINPTSGDYAYCFDGLWMTITPYFDTNLR